MPRPLAITCGDPAGTGPDIIAGHLAQHPEYRDNIFLFGPRSLIARLGVAGEPVGPEDFVVTPGKPSEAGHLLALNAMTAAAEGCRTGKFSAVVTGPVSKHGLAAVGFRHPGQTEFFEEKWGGEAVMAFVGETMRVVLATRHIPLAEVPAKLDRPALNRAVRAAAHLSRSLGKTAPRIAVCGLNPHAGEEGLLGSDERERLDPWLDALRPEIPGLSRCLPGDTVFFRHRRGDFDAVVALYHDQGLAPLKTLEFDSAVNLTLGLPHIRTSPDHGTGYDIAGTGRADIGSWTRAVSLAQTLSGRVI